MSWYSCRGYGHHRAISASNAISNSRAEAGDKREYLEAYVLGGEHVEGSDASIFMLLGANAALADDARSECGPEITGLCGGFQFWFRPAQFKRSSQNERLMFEHLRLSRQSACRTSFSRCHIERLVGSCEGDRR